MSDKVQFIDVDYIKQNSTIQYNVDDDLITPIIHKVQDTRLQSVLGTTFYNTLKNAVISSTTNSDEYTLLVDYIQPFINEWVVYEIIPFINYKLTNKAVSQQNSEFSQSSPLDDVKFLRNSVKDVADFYEKRLTNYLCDNSNLFPTYLTPDAKENIHKSSKRSFNGLYIPKRNNGCGDCNKDY